MNIRNILKEKRLLRLRKKFVDLNLIKSVKTYYSDSNLKLNIKTQSRSSTILPCFVDLIIYVYNGKKYIPLLITKDFLGHKFGEFILTRKFLGHKKDGKKLSFKKKLITPSKPYKHARVRPLIKNIFNKKFILKKKNEKKNSSRFI